MLEPGAWIEVTGEGHVQRGKYFEFPRCETPTLKGGEAIGAVDASITDAVRRQSWSVMCRWALFSPEGSTLRW